MSQTIVFRLSWVKYVSPIMRLFIFVGATILYLNSFDKIWSRVADSMPDAGDGTRGVAALLPVLFLMAGALRAVWTIWLNKTTVLTVESHGVAYHSGILPWKRSERYWRYHQIFSTKYSNDPEFLGWLLRFGDLVIVGREGSTHEYRIRGLHDPRRAQILIANRIEK